MINETNQWIPLSGPGGRLPNEADGDEFGRVYFARPEYDSAQRDHWYSPESATHFCPIPKAPPLPKPVEKTQEEKDWEKDWEKYCELCTRGTATNRADVLDGMKWARSDGRAQLAREALGLLDFKHAQAIAIDQGYQSLPIALRHLHELLTKASEATP